MVLNEIMSDVDNQSAKLGVCGHIAIPLEFFCGNYLQETFVYHHQNYGMLLGGSTADEEPLVYRAVNRGRQKVLVGSNRRELVGLNAAVGVADSQVGTSKSVRSVYFLGIRINRTYVATSPGWVLPVMSFSQASAHSRMTSMA
jgi:hypothetical protein